MDDGTWQARFGRPDLRVTEPTSGTNIDRDDEAGCVACATSHVHLWVLVHQWTQETEQSGCVFNIATHCEFSNILLLQKSLLKNLQFAFCFVKKSNTQTQHLITSKMQCQHVFVCVGKHKKCSVLDVWSFEVMPKTDWNFAFLKETSMNGQESNQCKEKQSIWKETKFPSMCVEHKFCFVTIHFFPFLSFFLNWFTVSNECALKITATGNLKMTSFWFVQLKLVCMPEAHNVLTQKLSFAIIITGNQGMFPDHKTHIRDEDMGGNGTWWNAKIVCPPIDENAPPLTSFKFQPTHIIRDLFWSPSKNAKVQALEPAMGRNNKENRVLFFENIPLTQLSSSSKRDRFHFSLFAP